MGLTSSSLSASSRGAVLHAARPSQLAQPSVRLVSFVAGGRGSASSNAESRFSAEAQQLAALSRHRGARERPLGLCGGFGKADSASLSEGSENAAASAGFWLGGEGCLASQHMPWRGALPLGCTDGSAQSWALLQQVRHSKHPLKLKSREIRHPHVVSPEHLPPPRYTEARLEGLQKFVPVNFYSELVSRILSLANADCRLCEKGAGVFAPCKSLQRADSAREGVFTGLDGCLSFNGKWKSWRRRKYNTKQHSTHTHASQVKGVNYLSRLHVFAVQWHEDGVHRIRWFRAAYGIQRAKRAAELFRRKLEETGRVDGAQTERQLMQKAAAKRRELRLRKKLFAKISSGHF